VIFLGLLVIQDFYISAFSEKYSDVKPPNFSLSGNLVQLFNRVNERKN